MHEIYSKYLPYQYTLGTARFQSTALHTAGVTLFGVDIIILLYRNIIS
jgi:hypothetical protein